MVFCCCSYLWGMAHTSCRSLSWGAQHRQKTQGGSQNRHPRRKGYCHQRPAFKHWHCNKAQSTVNKGTVEERIVYYNRWTYSSDKGGLRQGVIQDERKLPTEVSHNLAGWDWTPVPQGPVGLYEDSHLIRSLAQAIMLLQVGNVLNVPLEQAEDVIHSTKQPGQENKVQNQLNVMQSTVGIYQIPNNKRTPRINHYSR